MKALCDIRRTDTLLDDQLFLENELEVHYLKLLVIEEGQCFDADALSEFLVVVGGFVDVHGFGVSICVYRRCHFQHRPLFFCCQHSRPF